MVDEKKVVTTKSDAIAKKEEDVVADVPVKEPNIVDMLKAQRETAKSIRESQEKK